jgi:hypothetical protein
MTPIWYSKPRKSYSSSADSTFLPVIAKREWGRRRKRAEAMWQSYRILEIKLSGVRFSRRTPGTTHPSAPQNDMT